MELDFYRINAFTNQSFTGNPASVVFLPAMLNSPELYTKIAAEMATPETAFLLPFNTDNFQEEKIFSLRWFMATHEVKMCGHATLAAAYALFHEAKNVNENVIFKTLSGDIEAQNLKDKKIALDFPIDSFEGFTPSQELLEKLSIKNHVNAKYSEARNLAIIEVDSLTTLQSLQPNFELLKQHKELNIKKVAVTTSNLNKDFLAPTKSSEFYHFASRCFCPWIGINEDALSAASHTLIAKYWTGYFPKQKHFRAFQVSQRTGELEIIIKSATRMSLIGHSVVSLKGKVMY